MQFENCVLGMHDKALKLLIKKTSMGSCLEDSHLSISVESFDTALEIISSKYLDERYLVEQISVATDSVRPVRERGVSSIGYFLSEIKSLLYELKNYFSLDFLEEGTPGNSYFSHLIMHKLLMFLRKESFRALGHIYLSLGEIFDTYSNVLRVMELTKYEASNAESYKSEWGISSNTRESKSAVISKKKLLPSRTLILLLSRISLDAVFAVTMRILPIIVKNTLR